MENELSPHFEAVLVSGEDRPLSSEELIKLMAPSEVAICMLTDRIDEALLKALPKLKCLITYSVGMDHLDLDALKKRHVHVVHTPSILTNATADLTWALLLGCARRAKEASQYVESGKFTGFDPSLLLGKELSGAGLGIVGMGRIGKAVAERGIAFGMKILYTDYGRPDEQRFPGGTKMPFRQLLAEADVLSLHCPLRPSTRRLIGAVELANMKKDAILINTARGPLIDEPALVRHLKTHPDFYAGLDVFELEPQLALGLDRLPNALCFPHLGSATVKTRLGMAQVCVEEAIRFAKGQTLRYEYRTEGK